MEIGKQYRVFASNKKSFIEECVWAKGEFKDETYQAVTISEVMRNGSYLVTPQNQDELEYLEGGSYQDDDEIFEFDYFVGFLSSKNLMMDAVSIMHSVVMYDR